MSTCATNELVEILEENQCSSEPSRLYIVDYIIETEATGKGIAIVKAYNPREAEILLKSGGLLKKSKYKITRVEEIHLGPAIGVISEQFMHKDYE